MLFAVQREEVACPGCFDVFVPRVEGVQHSNVAVGAKFVVVTARRERPGLVKFV